MIKILEFNWDCGFYRTLLYHITEILKEHKFSLDIYDDSVYNCSLTRSFRFSTDNNEQRIIFNILVNVIEDGDIEIDWHIYDQTGDFKLYFEDCLKSHDGINFAAVALMCTKVIAKIQKMHQERREDFRRNWKLFQQQKAEMENQDG